MEKVINNGIQQKLYGYQTSDIADSVYEGTPNIQRLLTKKTPKEIFTTVFPNHCWPISGGWGYTQEDAIELEVDNSGEAVGLEYKILRYRCFMEAIVFKPKGEELAGFKFDDVAQELRIGDDGKTYDVLKMAVSAYKKEDFDMLKEDWESHEGYANDVFGRQKHRKLEKSKRIQYEVTGWFDISMFY